MSTKVINNNEYLQRQHNLGDMIRDGDDFYLIVRDPKEGNYRYLSLDNFELLYCGYDTLEDMHIENDTDIIVDAEIIIK
jgi:hypothetical protein